MRLATLGQFLVVLEGHRGKQERQTSALISPSQDGLPQPFSSLHLWLLPHSQTHTRTSPQEAAVSAADFHAFKSIRLWSHELGHKCVYEWIKKRVTMFVSVQRLGRLSEGHGMKILLKMSSQDPVTVKVLFYFLSRKEILPQQIKPAQ